MSQFSDEQFNYIEHLQLDQLLSSQKMISPHPEEMLFVIMATNLTRDTLQ